MNLVTLDLEGVLIPEIWIAFADAAGIPGTARTTRDDPTTTNSCATVWAYSPSAA